MTKLTSRSSLWRPTAELVMYLGKGESGLPSSWEWNFVCCDGLALPLFL